MSTKEERGWPRRAPPDASAGFNMFTNQRTSLGNGEGTSHFPQSTATIQEEDVGTMDGNQGERLWTSMAHPDDSAGSHGYNSIRSSMGIDEGTSFVMPEGGVTTPVDGFSMNRHMSGRRPPLDTLLIPRSSASSQANSFAFDGSAPLSARRNSPLRTSSSSEVSPGSSFTPSPSGSPSVVARRRASLPNTQPNPSAYRGGLQPRVPSSPNTGPWHGRSFSDASSLTPRTPSPSGQRWIDSPGFQAFGGPPNQLAMNRLVSVPASPVIPRSPTWGYSRGTGGMSGRLESPSYGRGPDNYSEAVGNFEPASTGSPGLGMLEDAIKSQQFERVAALLEQGFSPNGERGSSKSPPLIFAVSTGNERLVRLLLSAGANINGCDSQQYTALHYAAASGHWGIVKLLVNGGANLYAKTHKDLLPVQLTTDQVTYDYLSARMKSDMEDRISPRQLKPPSPRPPPRKSNFERARVDQDQWTNDSWVSNSRSMSFAEAGEPEKSMQTLQVRYNPGVSVNAGEGREISSSGQVFGENSSSNIIMQPGYGFPDRQTYSVTGRQGAGANAMDWDAYRDVPPHPTYQSYDYRGNAINHGQNMSTNERVGLEQRPMIDVWMPEGSGSSRALLTRPSSAPLLQERPPQRAPIQQEIETIQQEIETFQQDLFRQNSAPPSRQNLLPKVYPLQRAPSAPAELAQEMQEIKKDWSQNVPSTSGGIFEEAQVASIPEKEGNGLLRRVNENETEVSIIADVPQEVECDDGELHTAILPMRNKFSRACDSMAPSMMEKFKAISSGTGQPLEVEKLQDSPTGKVSETAQAPETPRQEGESQEKLDSSKLNRSGGPSSNSEKGKSGYVDPRPVSALKGDAMKSKEKKKSVKFALADSPSEEDLALIREDWREAARSGCVGCGKAGCDGLCLSPEKTPPAPSNGAASSSSGSQASSSSSATSEQILTDAKSSRKGTFRWTRGELLGEGAYGKVFAGLNQETGELMAVKQLKLDTPAEGQERQFYLQALEREISLYKTMRHKHIVGYIDMEQDLASGSLYVFLEYVSGGSIQSMLERFGRFSEPLVRVYTRQLLLGLEYLHGKKIVHRDIKGGNVLVDADGVVKLADFGASKAFHDPTQTDGFKSIRGSVFWMAPEVIKGDGYGRRADIWSVGCTVVEMLTAVHPWPGMDNTWTAIFHIAKASSGPPIPDEISDIVKDFLAHCFQLDPKKRPTSSELLQHPFVAENPPQSL